LLADAIHQQNLADKVTAKLLETKNNAILARQQVKDFTMFTDNFAEKVTESSKRAVNAANQAIVSAQQSVVESKKWWGLRKYKVNTFKNGNRYKGEWKDNNMNGYGILKSASGDRY
jgi:hypothetical protein